MRPLIASATLTMLGAVMLAAAPKPPNVLLILSDDHSYPHLGAYGDANCQRFKLTPNLDSLAKQGIRFERAYTAAPQCAPSRFAQPARSDTPLFTDALRENGYWVGLDGRHQHLNGRVKGLPHVSATLEELGMKGEVFESRFDHFVGHASTRGAALLKVGEKVGAVLDSVPEGKPWFLYFGFNQPHRPFGDDHSGIDPSRLVLPPD